MKTTQLTFTAYLLIGFVCQAQAGLVFKDLTTQGAIHISGDAGVPDYYGSGNDDSFAEYGIAGFAFDASDFGGNVASINSVVLKLIHNDRNFSDGSAVEFFFTPDTVTDLSNYSELSYDNTLINGINAQQYNHAAVSLGVFAYTPEAGGAEQQFTLDFSGHEQTLINSINSASDFQIIIAATAADADITFSGLNNTFDPGNPNLSIDASVVPVPAALPLFISALAGFGLLRRKNC